MKWKPLWFVGVIVCVLFYAAVALAYFVPQIATYRPVGRAMLILGLIVVAPTFVGLLARLCRQGLRPSGNNASNTSGSEFVQE
jgi:drug/metabolite transporter (DMT)-like permease